MDDACNFNFLVAILLTYCELIILILCIGTPSSQIINSYTKYLKTYYQKPLPYDERLLRDISKIFIDLAVISSENIPREEADDLMNLKFHGQTDKILLKKRPITLEDILKPGEDGKPIRRVLVEGAPGAGKSRLAWELCHRWKELDSVKHYKLVVLVQLRGKRAQEAKNLSDLFPLSNNNNIEQVINAIGNGDGVLIILEGFDELPRDQRQKGSVYINLIEREELLPEATVIITSRPSVSAYLIDYPIDRRLEILGFTEAKIEQYARNVSFSDSKTHEDFLEYINGNPFIKRMMYLPLNAVFVASIFELHHRTDLPYPKTMTQLYDAVILSLIRRHLVDKNLELPDFTMPTQSLESMEDIKKLPKQVPHQLLELAKLAYEGLLNEKYVFTDPGSGNELFDHLGVMKKTVSLDNYAGPIYTFTFLHLTLQEYLSALHMSLVLSSTQMYDALVRRHIRNHIIKEKLKPADYHMPQTLLSMKFVNSLPHGVGKQLLLLAQIAYEGVRDNKYEFTDFANGSEFVHFGMMKIKQIRLKNTSDPKFISDLVFLNHTLQEYLSALYENLTNKGNIPVLHWHSDLGLPLPPNSKDIVLRFLAGLCKYSSSFSCQQVGDLALDSFILQVPCCMYESDSIVQENQKIQERFKSNKVMHVSSGLSFDYYLIGHCICHYGGMWGITCNKEENIKLLVQGLNSCNGSSKGKLLELTFTNVDLLELDPILVIDLQQLTLHHVTFTASNVDIIRKHISSDRGLKAVYVYHCEDVELLFPIVFGSSSLDTVLIVNRLNSLHINYDAMNLLMNNSNIKHLTLNFPLKLPADTVCHITSIDFLAKSLLMFISSKPTLPKIQISRESSEFNVFLHFKKTNAGNKKPEFTITIHNTHACNYDVIQQILARIPEQYHT